MKEDVLTFPQLMDKFGGLSGADRALHNYRYYGVKPEGCEAWDWEELIRNHHNPDRSIPLILIDILAAIKDSR